MRNYNKDMVSYNEIARIGTINGRTYVHNMHTTQINKLKGLLVFQTQTSIYKKKSISENMLRN